MTPTDTRYAALVRSLAETVMSSPGDTPSDLRRAVQTRAAGGEAADLPASLDAYVEKVAQHAYRVRDGDVQALKRAGFSEDAIFEITLAAAVGAGLTRLQRGLAALKGGG